MLTHLDSPVFKKWIQLREGLRQRLSDKGAKIVHDSVAHLPCFFSCPQTPDIQPATHWQDYGVSCDAWLKDGILTIAPGWFWGERKGNHECEVAYFYRCTISIDGWIGKINSEELADEIENELRGERILQID